MNLKINLSEIKVFAIRRLFELLSLIILTFSLFITISLISYSPTDPNFIYSADSEVRNFLVFMEALHLTSYSNHYFISFLIPVTFFYFNPHF